MATVSVKSIPEKFHRCGLKFTREPRTVEVSAEQLKALKAEKNLIVEEGKAKATDPSELSINMNSDKAIDKLSKMGDAAAIKAFIKGDERKGVNDAAEEMLASLK